MFGDRFSSSTSCSKWRRETKPGRLDQSRSCYFLKVATHPLEPLLGRAAPVFFGLGLFAAGLTSAITAPLAATYAAGGALGWPPDLRSGRFRLLWGFVLATGVFCAVALGGSPYYVILLAQAGNGLVLPLTLILLLMVVNKTRIMGTHRNSRLTNVLGVIVVLVISWLALLQLARVLGRAG